MAQDRRGNASGSAGSTPGYVLVVDSDARNLVFMSMILQRLAYRACSALGVGNALEMADASAPSLIITELNLKGLSGLDLMHHIRQKPGTSTVPIIIMTKELTLKIEHQCREAGAVACLGKPVQAGELYQVIHRIIDPASRRASFRIQTRLNVTVNDRSLDCVEGECATNLSANGMYIRTAQPYPLHAQVQVRLDLNEEVILAEAKVVYCRTSGEEPSGMWGIGLQFLNTSPQGREFIRQFINDEISHGLAPGWE